MSHQKHLQQNQAWINRDIQQHCGETEGREKLSNSDLVAADKHWTLPWVPLMKELVDTQTITWHQWYKILTYLHVAFVLDWLSAGSKREYPTHGKQLSIYALQKKPKELLITSKENSSESWRKVMNSQQSNSTNYHKLQAVWWKTKTKKVPQCHVTNTWGLHTRHKQCRLQVQKPARRTTVACWPQVALREFLDDHLRR